jgi:hypothetical protein
MKTSRSGTTLIDLVMSMAIIALLFGGVYLVYFSIETAIANVSVRNAATAALQNEIETIRNLPYTSVGTTHGIPLGVIPQTQAISIGNFSFILQTEVLNIQDPYDQTPSSTPVADYKLVDVTVACPLCNNFVPIEITTTVAPATVSQSTGYGSLYMNVIDANGIGVPAANVRVVNASITPTIDLTDTTNASGILELIGVPTSTQGYQVFASKSGLSSAQTYPIGAPSNPTPAQPNITVVPQTVSNITFAIDRLSTLMVETMDNRCNAIITEPFTIRGSKLIGLSPAIFKYATSTQTNASGSRTFSNMEWDTYGLTLTDVTKNVVGTIPLDPMSLNPSSTQIFQFILQSAANPSLLVTTVDAATGAGIEDTIITASNGGFSRTLVTNHATFSQSDWSGGQYATQDGGIDASQANVITLLANASSSYTTSTVDWLMSNMFDVGGTNSTFNTISWSPAVQPANTTLEFQVAANNDKATWNFIGPDGTANTYFTASSTLPSSLAGNRYFRYEVFMSTQDPSVTPLLSAISFDFSADCVPPAQVLFTGLPQGASTLDVTAANYNEATTSVSIGSGFQSSTIFLVHQ